MENQTQQLCSEIVSLADQLKALIEATTCLLHYSENEQQPWLNTSLQTGEAATLLAMLAGNLADEINAKADLIKETTKE